MFAALLGAMPAAAHRVYVAKAISPDGVKIIGSVSKYVETTGAARGDFVHPHTGLKTPGSIVVYNGYAYVADSVRGNVLRYDQATGRFAGIFIAKNTGGLSNPDMLYFRNGILYVSDRFSGSIKRYNETTGAFIDTFVTDTEGRLNGFIGFTFGPDGNIYAAMFNGIQEVLRFSGTTGTFIDVFTKNHPVLNSAFDQLVFGPDGNLYASRVHANVVERYNGVTGEFIDTFASTNMSSPDYLLFTTCTHQLLVGNLAGYVTKYDATSGAYLGVFADLAGYVVEGLAEYLPTGCH